MSKQSNFEKALAAKKGKTDPAELSPAAKYLFKNMTVEELEVQCSKADLPMSFAHENPDKPKLRY